jgi:hypothetical protein
MTVPEVRRLLWQLLRPPPVNDAHVWAWSWWRRHHQAVATHCHYNRRLARLAAPAAQLQL